MDPISLTALGLGVSAVGSLYGAYLQNQQYEKAQGLIDAAVDEYGPEVRGILDQYAAEGLAQSGVRAETEAPEAVAAQREALRRMQQVAAGGYTPEEEAALRNIQAQTAAQAAGQQATLMEQFQRRGALGSGAQLAMAQQAGQAAANRAGMQGLSTAAEAQRRAFQAMQAQGSLGSQVRGQAYGEAERRAQAADQKRQFDVAARSTLASNIAGMKTGGATQLLPFAMEPGKQVTTGGVAAGSYLIGEDARRRRGAYTGAADWEAGPHSGEGG